MIKIDSLSILCEHKSLGLFQKGLNRSSEKYLQERTFLKILVGVFPFCVTDLS